MSAIQSGDRLATAISLRESGDPAAALQLLEGLHRESPDDARVNLQCAWAHDSMGSEREAVPFYERALELGLSGNDLRHALLGLGSTHRSLGNYEKALSTLSRGVDEFPDDHGLKVFQAMALYNVDRAKEACELLLRLLSETTSDPAILAYGRAIDLYAGDLDRTWS